MEAQGRRISRTRLVRRVGESLDSGSLILTAGAGCGKTTSLEQALAESTRPVAWVSCSDTEQVPGALLVRIAEAIARAAPGASDALMERLSAGVERIDVRVATRELLAELSRLLVEPLVLVIDDAEHLEGADGSLRLVGELIRAELPALRVAVASRRSLDLRVAKPRAAGRLTELSAADLAFDAEECAALLRERTGLDPSPEQVEEAMQATEGWPLGIALAAGLVSRGGRGGGDAPALANLGSAPDLHSYLAEELLDSLDPELREAAIASSAVPFVTPGVARALDLPNGFEQRIERAGLLLRHSGEPADGFAYHPLLREFLLERLREHSDEDERLRLHRAIAPAVAEDGDPIGAIEHWLEAGGWPEAVAAIEREGPVLLRTSPELLTRWLAQLPVDVQKLPAIRMLEGELEWGAGEHEKAVVPLREAVAGYREAQDPGHEWLARLFLAQALFWAGLFEEMLELADGWDAADAPRHAGVVGVAWHKVLALTALGRRDEAARLAARLRPDPKTASLFKHVNDLARVLVDLPAGRAEAALADPHTSIRELERHDPHGRLSVVQSVTALVHLDIGEVGEAMELFERSHREAERHGLGFVAGDAQLQRAALLAQQGELADAELELGRASPYQGTGWRSISRHTVEAFVAASRGEAPEAVAAAERALAQVRPGPVCFRVWAALDVAIALAESGSPDLAGRAIEEARSALDEQYPGELGHYHRARLIATTAWLEYETGEREAAYDSLRRCWAEAGDNAHQLARAHWRQLRPILWQALAEGEIDPRDVVPALENAFPGREALIALAGHPEAAVRRAVLPAALASNHPAVLSQLSELAEDPDEHVAGAAVATRERLRNSPLPLTFSVLGRFRVARGGWEVDEQSWGRPIDARLVRFLLLRVDQPVPEDLILEALWPGLSASNAQRSLRVAASRARHVLDPPGAERSVIESADRAYRLTLADRDTVDAERFRSAADAALAQPSERTLLERARSLWEGEPLPEERYSDWATPYRERLADRYIAVLSALVELHELAGEHAHAVDAARELVALDPLNEGGHRALITAYARTGRRGHALRQYLECRRALVEELGVEPTESTSRLQARILAGETV